MVKKSKINSQISNEPDLVLEQQAILTPGDWNGIRFTESEIRKGIDRTDWNRDESSRVIWRHTDQPDASDWVGKMYNVRYLTMDDGVEDEGMYADIDFYDPVLAKKLFYGKAELGLSIDSPYTSAPHGAANLYFTNTAMVVDPGCKTAFIQLADNEGKHKATFTRNIKLENEITSDSSQGNSAKQFSNQKIAEPSTSNDEKIIQTKKEDELYMTEKVNLSELKALESRVSLLEGSNVPVANTTPAEPVATPAPEATPEPVSTPEPAKAPEAPAEPVKQPEPAAPAATPEPAKAPEVPAVPAATPAPAMDAELVNTLLAKIDKLETAIAKSNEPKQEAMKPAAPQTVVQKTGDLSPSTGDPFLDALKRVNSELEK